MKRIADKPLKGTTRTIYNKHTLPVPLSRHATCRASQVCTSKLKCRVDTWEADESDNSIETTLETLPVPPRLPDAPILASDFLHSSRHHATITHLWGNMNKLIALCSYIHTYSSDMSIPEVL